MDSIEVEMVCCRECEKFWSRFWTVSFPTWASSRVRRSSGMFRLTAERSNLCPYSFLQETRNAVRRRLVSTERQFPPHIYRSTTIRRMKCTFGGREWWSGWEDSEGSGGRGFRSWGAGTTLPGCFPSWIKC